MTLQQETTLAELEAALGTDLGVSPWLEVTQARVDAFADVTEDHQFIHVDPARAAKTPLGGTIAHGLLTLSLIVHLCLERVPKLRGTTLVLNYGFDRVRFVAPVRVGKRIRASTRLAGATLRKPGQVLIKLDVTIEIEGEEKPALTAEWLSLHTVEE
jgi:acyl dehydratase